MIKTLWAPIGFVIALMVFWCIVFLYTSLPYIAMLVVIAGSVAVLLYTSFLVPFLLNCKVVNRFLNENSYSKNQSQTINDIEHILHDIAEFYYMDAPKVVISVGDMSVNSFALDGLISKPLIGFTEGSLEELNRAEIKLMLEYHMHGIATGNCFVSTFNSSLVSFLNIIVAFLSYGALGIGSQNNYKPNLFTYIISYISAMPFFWALRFLYTSNPYYIDSDAQGIVKGRYTANGSDLLVKVANHPGVSRVEAIPLFSYLYYHSPVKRDQFKKGLENIYYNRISNIYLCQSIVRNHLIRKLGLSDLGISASGMREENNPDFMDAKALKRRIRLDNFKRSLQESDNLSPNRNIYSGTSKIDVDINNRYPWGSGEKRYKFIEKTKQLVDQKEKLENYRMQDSDIVSVLREFEEKKPDLRKARSGGS